MENVTVGVRCVYKMRDQRLIAQTCKVVLPLSGLRQPESPKILDQPTKSERLNKEVLGPSANTLDLFQPSVCTLPCDSCVSYFWLVQQGEHLP